MGKAKRAALYVRVSTDHQSVENQVRELKEVAERRGWTVVEIYRDAGISGAKGRDKRPGLDAMLKDASRRKFDVVMAWAIDRLGRSLIDLLGTIQHLEEVGVDLYLDQQSHRHHHAGRQAAVPDDRRLRRIRALDDPPAGPGWAQRHQGQARPRRQVRQQGGQGAQEAGPARCRTRQDRARPPGAWPRASASARWLARLASASAPSTGSSVRLGNMPPIDVEHSANATCWPKDGQFGTGPLPPWPSEKKRGKFGPPRTSPELRNTTQEHHPGARPSLLIRSLMVGQSTQGDLAGSQ